MNPIMKAIAFISSCAIAATSLSISMAGFSEASACPSPGSMASIAAEVNTKSGILTEQEYAELVLVFEKSEWGKTVRFYGQDRSVGTAAIKKAIK